MKKVLIWSEPTEPDGINFHYNHLEAYSPLGQFSIQWKGWKKFEMYTLMLEGEPLDAFYTIEDAKHSAVVHIRMLADKLNEY